MNVPAIIAIPIRIVFVLGVCAFIGIAAVCACAQWFYTSVMED
jgi:hypothetical protein